MEEATVSHNEYPYFIPKGESMTIKPYNPDQALLDHLAGLAMQALILHPGFRHSGNETIAMLSYLQAEAIMAERNKRMEKQP